MHTTCTLQGSMRMVGAADRAQTGRNCPIPVCNLKETLVPLQVCYPKQTDKPLYKGLVTQLESLQIPFVDADHVLDGALDSKCDIVMDAMFGFGFKGAPRPPFDALLDRLRCAP